MNMSTTIPATVQIKRTSLICLVALAAVLAAAAMWLVLEFAVGTASPQASAPAVVAHNASPRAAGGLTRAKEQSIGTYLFGSAIALTPDQRKAVRDYFVGASLPMSSSQASSIASFLLGTAGPLTKAQLNTVRNYWIGATSSGQIAEKTSASAPSKAEANSIATYLFGHARSLTPQERRMVSYYWLAAASGPR